MTPLERAIEALKEIEELDFSFEGYACLHCEMANEALGEIRRELSLLPVKDNNERP